MSDRVRSEASPLGAVSRRPDLSDLDRRTDDLIRRVAALELAVRRLMSDGK